MKNIIIIAVILANTIHAFAQKRLANKKHPVHFVAIVRDKHQEDVNLDRVWIEEKSGKKIVLKHTAVGTYECYVRTEKDTQYTLMATLADITYNGNIITLKAMTSKKQMVAKTIGIDLSKKEVLSMRKKQDNTRRSALQPVILQINVKDEAGQPIDNAKVSMHEESINLKIEDLDLTSRGVYETKVRQDHAHTFQFWIEYNGKVHKVDINLPATNNETQFVRKTFVCDNQNMIAETSKGDDNIKSVGANQDR